MKKNWYPYHASDHHEFGSQFLMHREYMQKPETECHEGQGQDDARGNEALLVVNETEHLIG